MAQQTEEESLRPEMLTESYFRSVTSKPTVSGLSTSSILKNNRQNVSLATVFLCPDQSCKLKLPSRATLLTHFKMCHTREISAEEQDQEEQDQLKTDDPLEYESDPDDPPGGKAGSKARKKQVKSSPDEAKTYDCPDCGVKVTRKYHLLRHIKAVHEKEKFWQCDSCDYKTNNQACFKKHKQSKHDGGGDCDIRYSLEFLQNLPPGVKEEDLNCVCTWCAFRSNKYSIVKKHIEIHHERKKHYSCKECLFVGENVDDYAAHYHAFHKTDSYPHACTDCTFRLVEKTGRSLGTLNVLNYNPPGAPINTISRPITLKCTVNKGCMFANLVITRAMMSTI